MEERLVTAGWKMEGTLGPAGNVLARDPDGNMLEFVEEVQPDRGGRTRER
jgi:hypothetical protein